MLTHGGSVSVDYDAGVTAEPPCVSMRTETAHEHENRYTLIPSEVRNSTDTHGVSSSGGIMKRTWLLAPVLAAFSMVACAGPVYYANVPPPPIRAEAVI